MGKTNIEWTEMSWSPVTGCTKISAGCQNCYAERMAKRLAGRYGYPKQPDHFKVTLHKDKLLQPFKWEKSRMIFVCSMGDLFHKDVPDDYIEEVFDVIKNNPHHTFQVLTKRPDLVWPDLTKDIPNLWLGVTAENQAMAHTRIPWLLRTPAAVRFVSVEPMLEGIDIRQYLSQWHFIGTRLKPYCLDWVICGGETGHGAREMQWEWAWSLAQQCGDADIPFFFKKFGDAYKGDLKSKLAVFAGRREYPKDRNDIR